MTKYRSYQHIEKITSELSPNLEGLLEGTVYVFPKIDGSNAVVYSDNGVVRAGSRRRELTQDSDNFGFCKFVEAQESLKSFFRAFPWAVLYGEFLIKHTVATYRQDAWRNFYVFDVLDSKTDKYLSYEQYVPALEAHGLTYIPPQKILVNPEYKSLLYELDANTYLLQDGCIGEGIVAKNYQYLNPNGEQIWGKIVRNEFKEQNKQVFGIPISENHPIEAEIVERMVTQAFLDKEALKFIGEMGTENRKELIPRLLETVWHTWITEDIYHILKNYKNPTVDFRRLRLQFIHRFKALKPDLF
jgi:hypothetical protein